MEKTRNSTKVQVAFNSHFCDKLDIHMHRKKNGNIHLIIFYFANIQQLISFRSNIYYIYCNQLILKDNMVFLGLIRNETLFNLKKVKKEIMYAK